MSECVRRAKRAPVRKLMRSISVRSPTVLLAPPVKLSRDRDVQKLTQLTVIMRSALSAQSLCLLADVEANDVNGFQRTPKMLHLALAIGNELISGSKLRDMREQRVKVVHHERGRDCRRLEPKQRFRRIQTFSHHVRCDDWRTLVLSFNRLNDISQSAANEQCQQSKIFELLLLSQNDLSGLTPRKPARDPQRNHGTYKLSPAGQLVVVLQSLDDVETSQGVSYPFSASGQRNDRHGDGHPRHRLPKLYPLIAHECRIAFSAIATTGSARVDNLGPEAKDGARSYG